jgi:hypothetical protein
LKRQTGNIQAPYLLALLNVSSFTQYATSSEALSCGHELRVSL